MGAPSFTHGGVGVAVKYTSTPTGPAPGGGMAEYVGRLVFAGPFFFFCDGTLSFKTVMIS